MNGLAAETSALFEAITLLRVRVFEGEQGLHTGSCVEGFQRFAVYYKPEQ